MRKQTSTILLVLRRQIKIVLLFSIMFFWNNRTYAQDSLRRHFIIAYDASTDFNILVSRNVEIRKTLETIFDDNIPRGAIGKFDTRTREKVNGIKFFDENHDEISFYNFNLSAEDIASLRGEADKSKFIQKIPERLFKRTHSWTDFKSYQVKRNITPNINDYFNNTFSPVNSTRAISDFTIPNLVFPLILNNFVQSKYAQEYILIILTQSTPLFVSFVDLEDLKKNIGRDDFEVHSLKKQIDLLYSEFDKVDYFNCASSSIFGYFITPKNVEPASANTAVSINSDIEFTQNNYKGNDFVTSPIQLKFPDNEFLTPVEVTLSIRDGGESEIFKDVIASEINGGEWSSRYSKGDKVLPELFSKLMKFDKSSSSYTIPSLKIDLESINANRGFHSLKLKFEIKSKAKTLLNNSLNFVFYAETIVPIQNIKYIGFNEYISYFIVPIIFILIVLIFLVVYGKPQKIKFAENGYLDSFEKIDYKTDGKLLTPFIPWNIEKENVDLLPYSGEIVYRSPGYFFNWNPTVALKLQVVTVPIGFEMFLKSDPEHWQEIPNGYVMELKKGKDNKLSFYVGIRQNNITTQVLNQLNVKFQIEAVLNDFNPFLKSRCRVTLNYNFLIGPDLGDVWVGFDPGTTGSCIAVGSALEESISLAVDKAKNKIIPSVLVFDKSENFHPNGAEVLKNLYSHGSKADVLYKDTTKFKGFLSIKKLLGYDNIKEIVFNNNETLKLKGTELASLLIKGLFNDVKYYFNTLDSNDVNYKRDGIFNPLRAVVAIPNNFTSRKIQDMVDCLDNLNQFKEIRCVYEAEAVLFYYLSNFSRLNESEDSLDSETILVFDMGGATINAMVVTVNLTLVNEKPKYDIDFLGKIGFGIGGDTIDYCISKFILSCSDEFSQIKGVDINKNQTQLLGLARKIKLEIYRNYNHNLNYLITRENLQIWINNELNLSINIDLEQSEMYNHFQKINGKFKLFSHSTFQKIIYDNIIDAVNEVVNLSGTKNIDKVIFAGRSTQFPIVKETVKNTLNNMNIRAKGINLNREELKTSVALGACWYGINKNAVRLNNLKTNAAFGFKKTISTDRTKVKFFELVKMGQAFDIQSNGIDSFQGYEPIKDDFALDGGKVNFYQVMGKDANKILAEGQKHKFSKIASIHPNKSTSMVAMKVNENDDVECAVILEGQSKPLIAEGLVSDQQIDEANEEHYTWTVK